MRLKRLHVNAIYLAKSGDVEVALFNQLARDVGKKYSQPKVAAEKYSFFLLLYLLAHECIPYPR